MMKSNHFSTPILGRSEAQLHIIEPCQTLFHVIYQRLKPIQIVSLCSNTDQSSLKMLAEYFRKFNEVLSLTLVDIQMLESIDEFGYYFPKLTRLSLRYKHQTGFYLMK